MTPWHCWHRCRVREPDRCRAAPDSRTENEPIQTGRGEAARPCQPGRAGAGLKPGAGRSNAAL